MEIPERQPRKSSIASALPAWGGRLLAILLALLALSFGLAWVATGRQGIPGWGSFLAVLLIGAGLLWAGWLAVQAGEREHMPRWLAGLLVGAALLRLLFGVIWFVVLPVAGHGSPEERAGYVMADANERDKAAWRLAKSDRPLWSAFQNNRAADQYGGMLFLSALLYRILGPGAHRPLLVVVITAAFSALAVLLAWAFTRRAWGASAAGAVAWILALYPEAVLLGSSQMREAFTITLTAGAFYGLVRYAQDHSLPALVWMFGSILLYLPFSPLLATLLVIMLALAALALRGDLLKGRTLQRRWLVWALLALAVLVFASLWLALRQFAPEKITNPVALFGWWLRKSAEWQANLSQHASGWMQKVFRSTPDWLQGPILIAYGVVQPFLPAALVASSEAPIWSVIAIWRSLGWTLLLPFLLYAPLRAFSRENRDGLAGALARAVAVIVWLAILVASFRGGGDPWDNPRYRATFAALQVALVAWVWVDQRRSADPWLRRTLVGVGLVLAWFLPWYLNRYTAFAWPVQDFFKTLGLGVASAVLYGIWDWARKK